MEVAPRVPEASKVGRERIGAEDLFEIVSNLTLITLRRRRERNSKDNKAKDNIVWLGTYLY